MADQEMDKLLQLAENVMGAAKSAGADVAEASVVGGWDLSTRVRLGKVERVEEAGQRHLALRVIKSNQMASSSTSDLSDEGLQRCVADALMLADLSEPDPLTAPAPPERLCHAPHSRPGSLRPGSRQSRCREGSRNCNARRAICARFRRTFDAQRRGDVCAHDLKERGGPIQWLFCNARRLVRSPLGSAGGGGRRREEAAGLLLEWAPTSETSRICRGRWQGSRSKNTESPWRKKDSHM